MTKLVPSAINWIIFQQKTIKFQCRYLKTKVIIRCVLVAKIIRLIILYIPPPAHPPYHPKIIGSQCLIYFKTNTPPFAIKLTSHRLAVKNLRPQSLIYAIDGAKRSV